MDDARGRGISVSVIIPTFNRAGVLGAAIESVLAQTRPAGQVIVVDDGSTDDTPRVLAGFGDRIEVLCQPNAGVAAARNAAIATAGGDWLTFLDSDDLWPRDRLAVLARDLMGAPGDITAHIGNLRYTGAGYDEDLFGLKGVSFPAGRAARLDDPLPLVLSGMSLISAAVRRQAFYAAGGFDQAMPMLSDTAFFCQLALEGPWLVTGDILAEGRRMPGDREAITSLARTDSRRARQMHLHYLDALLARELTPARHRLVARAASGALLALAEAEREAAPAKARRTLIRAARRHPAPCTGWAKSLLPMLLGRAGFRLARRRGRSLDRS